MEITPGSLTVIGLVSTVLALIFGLASYLNARQRASSQRRLAGGVTGGMATVPVAATGSAVTRVAVGAARGALGAASLSAGTVLDQAPSMSTAAKEDAVGADGAARLVFFREYIPESGRISPPAAAQPRGGRGFQWA